MARKKARVEIVPLSGGFMISTILGFLISAMYVYPKSETWGFTFMLIFVIMFISAMISMTYGPDTAQLHVGGKRYKEIKKKAKKKKR